MTSVTLDTNIFPADDLVAAAHGKPFSFAKVTVTDRETQGTQVSVEGVGTVLESGVWGESQWGRARFARPDSPTDEILQIISNNAFPTDRSQLTPGQRRQLRDAMIFEAHVRERRDIFVSNDERAFLRGGNKETLEQRFNTRILTRQEFQLLLG